MPDMILNIINEYVASVKKIFGTYLRKVIVYGSYARGDYNEKSDIDIMFIVTLNENEIHEKFNDVCDIAFEYEMKYGIVISPIIKNNQHFEKQKHFHYSGKQCVPYVLFRPKSKTHSHRQTNF